MEIIVSSLQLFPPIPLPPPAQLKYAMLIDAHTHLDMLGEALLPTALGEIAQHQIFTLSVSIDVDSYQHAKKVATGNPFIVPLFGIHPWEAHHFADDLASLDPFMAESPMLGEIGLDFYLGLTQTSENL